MAFANRSTEELIAEALESATSERELDLAMRLNNALEEIEALTKEVHDLRIASNWQGA